MTDETGVPAGRAPVIAIIGLGPLGRALGLALQGVKTRFELVGHDRDPARTRAALEAGAVDRGGWNLIAVASSADLVFVTEPLDELAETLALIGPELRPGTLVTDTASAKVEVLRLAEALLPAGTSFVGGHPVLRRSPAAAEGNLFDGASYCLSPLPSATDEAVRVLGNLVSAIGARPYFIDAAEHDALVAAVGHLPALVSAAVLAALEESPSIADLRRLAGPAFLEAVVLGDLDPEALRAEAAANAEALVRWLDPVVARLLEVRAALASGELGPLAEVLARAEAARAAWEYPTDEVPAPGFEALEGRSRLREMLFGERPGRP